MELRRSLERLKGTIKALEETPGLEFAEGRAISDEVKRSVKLLSEEARRLENRIKLDDENVEGVHEFCPNCSNEYVVPYVEDIVSLTDLKCTDCGYVNYPEQQEHDGAKVTSIIESEKYNLGAE